MNSAWRKFNRSFSWRFQTFGRGLSVGWKVLCFLPRWALYGVSWAMPRKRNLWVFGSLKDFFDNSKHFFIHVSRQVPEVEAVWISPNPQVVAQVRALGLKAVRRGSLAGIWHGLRARCHVYCYTLAEIDFFTSGRAWTVNLWHGTPLKKIVHDITTGPLAAPIRNPNWQRRFFWPGFYDRPTFLFTSSQWVTDHGMRSAFQVRPEQCLALGQPRVDLLSWDRNTLLEHVRSTGDGAVRQLLERFQAYRRVILYLPTFRDAGDDFLADAGLDAEALQALCLETDALLVIKLHRDSKPSAFEKASAGRDRILCLQADLDVNPLLAWADVLLTDYSSVMFDFAVTRRPILRYPFDLERYLTRDREMYVPYETVELGDIVTTPAELMSVLRRVLTGPLTCNYPDRAVERYHDHRDGQASERIARFLLSSAADQIAAGVQAKPD